TMMSSSLIVIFISVGIAGVIASDYGGYPAAAAVTAALLIMGIKMFDFLTTRLSLEFVSAGMFPEGVEKAFEPDSVSDLFRASFTVDGIKLQDHVEPIPILFAILYIFIGAVACKVNPALGIVYAIAMFATPLPELMRLYMMTIYSSTFR
nr:nonstructural protein NS2B [Parramatta River virus]